MDHQADNQRRFPLGVVLKGHGLRGETKVRPDLFDATALKAPFEALLKTRRGDESTVRVTAMRSASGYLYLTIDGIANRDEANALQGAELVVNRSEFVTPDTGTYYLGDLVGYQVVLIDGSILGTVREVWDLPANEVLAVDAENREVLIPLIDDVVETIDHDKRQVIIDPMEGLLD